MSARAPILSAIVAIAGVASGCESDPLRDYFVTPTPRERYEAGLRQAGLGTTALAREWIAAGQRALARAAVITTPYRELGYLDPAEPRAEAYRVELRRGQRLAADVVLDADSATHLFLDLFVLSRQDTGAAPPAVLLASADSLARSVDYVARRDGVYVLRIQPELLRGGRYTVTVDATASLGFPVVGADTRAIRSGFGAPRDAGRREHHGVDIFAPRGTPVVAASGGRVSRVSSEGRGGKAVWLRESDIGYALYYAHLDSQAVSRGMLVRPGDTLGFVGNTGNARTTPPHLHFGIYLLGAGPVDPFPFLFRPDAVPPAIPSKVAELGRWARVSGDRVPLRAAPQTGAVVRAELARHTAVRVLAASGAWYRVVLPDGETGFVQARLTEPADRPLRRTQVMAGVLIRGWPAPSAAAVDSVAAASEVAVLGVFRGFAYVATPSGRTGWVPVE